MREHILERLKHDPFNAFRIVLSSGQDIEVRDPDSVAVGESLMHVFYARSDRYQTVRLNQIVSTDILESAA
jgi:hypothetical protein